MVYTHCNFHLAQQSKAHKKSTNENVILVKRILLVNIIIIKAFHLLCLDFMRVFEKLSLETDELP